MENDLKSLSVHQAVRGIIRLLPRISDENLIRLTYLGKWLSNDPEVIGGVEKVRYLLETPGHPAKALFKRVLEYLPAERRIRLFETLFNGAWFKGGKARDHWEMELGFRPPFIMILSPTLHCNLRCKGCYTLRYGMKPELSLEAVYRLLTECEELGIYFITILGGEPRVYPHLFTMLEKHPSIFFQVYTNGTLMTKEKAERFAEAGNTAVVISIEGGEGETDAYAARWGRLADRVWAQEYEKGEISSERDGSSLSDSNVSPFMEWEKMHGHERIHQGHEGPEGH